MAEDDEYQHGIVARVCCSGLRPWSCHNYITKLTTHHEARSPPRPHMSLLLLTMVLWLTRYSPSHLCSSWAKKLSPLPKTSGTSLMAGDRLRCSCLERLTVTCHCGLPICHKVRRLQLLQLRRSKIACPSSFLSQSLLEYLLASTQAK